MNLTAKLGLNVTDFTKGLLQAENQSDSSFNRIRRELERVQSGTQRLADSMRSPFEKLQDRLNGLQFPDWQKDKLFSAFNEQEMLKGAIAAEKMLVKLRQQADEYGKTATEIQRLNLVRIGATQTQLAEFDAIQKNIQALKQQENQLQKNQKKQQEMKNIFTGVKQQAFGFIAGAVMYGVLTSLTLVETSP